jgi:flavin-dependent dehydrogenase
MAALKRASIIGGGLAGLACGITLRLQGWDVAVYERRRYPLKKVCGEFLSPLGWRRVQDLGAASCLSQAPVPLERARFYYSSTGSFSFNLRPGAWGLSREALDSALAERFRALGGDLHEAEAFPGAEGLVIDCSGRAMESGQAKWIGWKGYLDPGLADFEGITMLPLKGGYGGLSKVEDGRTSFCFVAKAPANVEQIMESHPLLASLASKIRFHASIAGFDFIRRPQALKAGDVSSVWPPLAGDGMSRALGGGMELAQALSEGRSARVPSDAVQFALSKSMHSLMLSNYGKSLFGPLLKLAPWVAEQAYQWTRG